MDSISCFTTGAITRKSTAKLPENTVENNMKFLCYKTPLLTKFTKYGD